MPFVIIFLLNVCNKILTASSAIKFFRDQFDCYVISYIEATGSVFKKGQVTLIITWEYYNKQLVRDDKYPRAEVTRGTRGYLSHAYNTWFTVMVFYTLYFKMFTHIMNAMCFKQTLKLDRLLGILYKAMDIQCTTKHNIYYE